MIWLLLTDIFLFLTGVVVIIFRSYLGLPDDLIGSLSGALLGGATVLAGVLLERFLAKRAEDFERNESIEKIKT